MAEEQAVVSGQYSTVGQKYQPDEGFIGYIEPGQPASGDRSGRLYVIADGAGGLAAGTVAGRYAVQKVLYEFYQATEVDLEKRLQEAIQAANKDILERNSHFPARRPMAAAVLAALIQDNKLTVASVGDGQVYVVWDQDIEHLNQETRPTGPDDSQAESPTEEDGQQLGTGLGLEPEVKIAFFSRRLFPGDIVVLASGGLRGYVSNEEIAKTVTQYPPKLASQRLAELASGRGSRGLVGVNVIRVLAEPVSKSAPSPIPAAPNWDSLSKPTPRPVGQEVSSFKAEMKKGTLQRGRADRRRAYIGGGLILALLILAALAAAWQFGWGTVRLGTEPKPGATEAAAGDQNRAEEEDSGPAVANSPLASPTPAGRPVGANSSPLATPTPGVTVTVRVSTGEVISPSLALSEETPVRGTATPEAAGPTATPLPTIELPLDCTDQGRFAGDITVRDGQQFAPGETFDKSWSLANYGSCPWGPGYTIRFQEGDRMGAENQVLSTVVPPGTMGSATVPMVAPSNSGSYRGVWQIHNLAGEPFGPELTVEIRVVGEALPEIDESQLTVLYDFVENATEATWLGPDGTYQVTRTPIDKNLVIPFPQGIVAVGQAEFGRDYQVTDEVLLTHPHEETGLIQGSYAITRPLQPNDVIIGQLGLPRAAVINDDGVTFEVIFKPDEGQEQVIFSQLVRYEDTPLTVREPLSNIEVGQNGVFTLRAVGGESLSYDWATWIELRLVRP